MTAAFNQWFHQGVLGNPLAWEEIANNLPASLQPYAERYGTDEVVAAGLFALGYPPSWVTSANEIHLVLDELEKEHGICT